MAQELQNRKSYSSLDELFTMLEDEFIPRNIIIEQISNTNEYKASIDLNKIKFLKLSKKDEEAVINYITGQGITINNSEQRLSSEFGNGNLNRSFNMNGFFSRILSSEESKNYIDVIKDIDRKQSTSKEDIQLRSNAKRLLIESYMSKIPYMAWKFANIYEIELEEVCSEAFTIVVEALNTYINTNSLMYGNINAFMNKNIRNTIISALQEKIGLTSDVEKLKSRRTVLLFFELLKRYNNENIALTPGVIEDIKNTMINNGLDVSEVNRCITAAKTNMYFLSTETHKNEVEKDFGGKSNLDIEEDEVIMYNNEPSIVMDELTNMPPEETFDDYLNRGRR